MQTHRQEAAAEAAAAAVCVCSVVLSVMLALLFLETIPKTGLANRSPGLHVIPRLGPISGRPSDVSAKFKHLCLANRRSLRAYAVELTRERCGVQSCFRLPLDRC